MSFKFPLGVKRMNYLHLASIFFSVSMCTKSIISKPNLFGPVLWKNIELGYRYYIHRQLLNLNW